VSFLITIKHLLNDFESHFQKLAQAMMMVSKHLHTFNIAV